MMQTYKDIEYQLTRRAGKTASICVERDGSVSVKVPESYDEDRLEQLLEAKRYWIYRHLATWEDLNAARVSREYANGEGFLYLGRSYRLRIVRGQKEPLLLKGGYFLIRSLDDTEKDASTYLTSVFKGFYRERGQEWIPERVAYFAPKLGVSPARVRVMELGHRWGSCSPEGGLNFHWKCMMAPLSILDYLVVHELAHLKHANHTPAFWDALDKIMPDYHERKAWLRVNGARMGV